MRRHLQLIFQDPQAALDPRMPIGAILAEPLRVFEPQLTGAQRQQPVSYTHLDVYKRQQYIQGYFVHAPEEVVLTS